MSGLVRNILVSAALLLLAQGAQAQTSLDTVRQYRVAALRQLGWDTTGNSFVAVADVDKMVVQAINQLPNFVWGEEKVTTLHIHKDSGVGGDAYYVDSNISQIRFAAKRDGDTLRILKQRPPPVWNDDYDKGEDQPGKYRPTNYAFFADTLYIYPAPKNTGVDTLRVAYYRAASASSDAAGGTVVLDRRFQLGVVYHTVYQILVSTDPLGDWKGAWERYVAWATTAKANAIDRPVDPLKDERTQ